MFLLLKEYRNFKTETMEFIEVVSSLIMTSVLFFWSYRNDIFQIVHEPSSMEHVIGHIFIAGVVYFVLSLVVGFAIIGFSFFLLKRRKK